MLRHPRAPDFVDELLEVGGCSAGPLHQLGRSAQGYRALRESVRAAVRDGLRLADASRAARRRRLARLPRLERPESRFDGADDAFLQYVAGQAVQGALERIARVDVLAVDPRFSILPV